MKYHKLAILESQRISLIHKLSSLPEENLRFRFSGSQWCVLEVLEHLILSEELSVSYVAKKLQEPQKLQKVSLASRIKLTMVNLFLRFNFKAKAPSSTIPSSNTSHSFLELSNRWESSRAHLEILSENSSGNLNKGVFKHPKVGMMNFDQMLSFFLAHKSHHLMQISTLLMANKRVGEALEFEDLPITDKQPNLRSI